MAFTSSNRSPSMSTLRALLSCVLLAVMTAAQGPNREQSHESGAIPTFKATTRLVTVEVVAKDRHGKIIPDLTEKDFQVFEEAPPAKGERPQKISGFVVVNHDAIVAASKQGTKLNLPTGVYTNLVSARLSVPPTILLLDGLNTEADSGTQDRR